MDFEKQAQELNIPKPKSNMKYTFLYTMAVGDNVLLDTATLNKRALTSCRTYVSIRYGKKFTLRTLPEGTRVWRLW